jgi:hypothetical protein
LAITLRLTSVAPLDTPVVPPVYCRKAGSSCPADDGVSFIRAPSATAALKRMASASVYAGTIFLTLRTTKLTTVPLSMPNRSPMLATTTCFTCVVAITCSSVAAKFSRITMASAPESISWCDNSRGV